MLGGNDGLNTVVPHGLDGYTNARRALRVPASQIQKITPEIGLHPSLGGMGKLLENGKLSILQGIGYPNPNRSHFRSMEIWHTASDSDKNEKYGWIGRYFDNACKGSDLQGEWRAPPKFNSLYIGLERYADSANDQNLWIDDVALSKARVGCPGKQKGAK
jgi:uncharacterized protein (DUF1501 family)